MQAIVFRMVELRFINVKMVIVFNLAIDVLALVEINLNLPYDVDMDVDTILVDDLVDVVVER